FTLTQPLTASHWYGIRLTTAALDLTGNTLDCAGATATAAPNCYWTFETGSSATVPGLLGMTPHDAATGVPTNAAISLQWTDPLIAAGQTDALTGFSLRQASGVDTGCYIFTGTGQTPLCPVFGGSWTNPALDSSRFKPTVALLANTSYTASESVISANLVANSSSTWTTGPGT